MAYHTMSDAELHDFLASDPPHTAKLATVREDGRPHLVPVWYALDGDTVIFSTGADSVKGTNIRTNGRLAICVDLETPPYAYVTIEGTAETTEDPDQTRHWAGVIGGRYLGADKAEELAERNGGPGALLVRVRPDRITSAADLAD